MIIAAGDIETKGLGGEVLCVSVAYSRNTVKTYYSVRQFLKSLFETITETIYFHFGGKYDFLYILQWLLREGVTCGYSIMPNSFFEIHGRIICFTVCKGHRRIRFRDSYALLPASLEKLGMSLCGRGKIASGKDIEKMSMKEIEEYCEADALLLYDVMIAAMSHFGTVDLKLTLASQALDSLVAISGSLPFTTPPRSIYSFEKQGNFGGHVDVYRRYSSPIYSYDIKSCYPYSAAEVGCPKGEFSLTYGKRVRKCGTYIVEYNISEHAPFIPTFGILKGGGGNKLFFPNGKFRGFATDIVLDYFPEVVNKILVGIEYDKEEDYFKPYMKKWYEYRSQGKAQDLIGKLLMNNAIGKFGISREREMLVIGAEDADAYYDLELLIGKKKQVVDFHYSCPTANSRVTEYGRLLLHHYQKMAGEDLCYSDTDSVKTSKPLHFEKKDALGELSYEGKHDRFYALAPKLYGMFNDGDSSSDVIHAKGALKIKVEGDADVIWNAESEQREKGIKEDDFKNALFSGGEIMTRANTLNSWKVAARTHADLVRASIKERVMSNFILKRKLLANGIDTVAYNAVELNIKNYSANPMIS